jgi:two-component system OmpR family sensor kinase
MNHPGRYHHRPLHRRVFVWFGVSILLAGLAAIAAYRWLGVPRWHEEFQRAGNLVASRFALVWDRPVERDELARAVSSELSLGLVLEDAGRVPVATYGVHCRRHPTLFPVRRGDQVLGYLGWCRSRSHTPWVLLGVLLAAGLTLWGASGALARHLTRPLSELTRVAREIGSGKLSARTHLGRHHPNEVGVLAEAIHEMATRIERQLADQRELLAVVSHELRTPLGHLGVMIDLLRERAADPDLLASMEQEIRELDGLIGELLAAARLDFAALSVRPISATEVAQSALTRTHLDPGLLVDESGGVSFPGDATLVGRALQNLLSNAVHHGHGVTLLRVRADQSEVVFEVEDQGPGFLPETLEHAFDRFYRGQGSAERAGSSLGLGLALVRRIAQAHGGRAWAVNCPGGGARVSFSVPQVPDRNAAPPA